MYTDTSLCLDGLLTLTPSIRLRRAGGLLFKASRDIDALRGLSGPDWAGSKVVIKWRRLRKIVLDASVVVKWFTKEEYSMQALTVKTESGEVDIVAPQLLIYELANTLRYNPAFGSDELRRAVHDLEAIPQNTTRA